MIRRRRPVRRRRRPPRPSRSPGRLAPADARHRGRPGDRVLADPLPGDANARGRCAAMLGVAGPSWSTWSLPPRCSASSRASSCTPARRSPGTARPARCAARCMGARRVRGPGRATPRRPSAVRPRRRLHPGAVPPPRRGRPDGRRGDAASCGCSCSRTRPPGARTYCSPQRGARQGAALRRVLARGAGPAALDARRARPAAADRGAPAHGPDRPDRRSWPRCCRWATRRTTATGPAR